ncbi:MAG: hypothetical protein ACRCUF_21975, partial [Aeromonas sobria]
MTENKGAAPLLRPYITEKGLEAAVQASGLGKTVKVVKVGLTATPGTATASDVSLPGAVMVDVADGRLVNSHQINISTLLPDTFPSMDICGIAFYLEDGTMFAVYREPQAFLEHTGGTTLLVGMDLVMDNIPGDSVIVESTGADLIMGDWVPIERKVNGKTLDKDITISHQDLKVLPLDGSVGMTGQLTLSMNNRGLVYPATSTNAARGMDWTMANGGAARLGCQWNARENIVTNFYMGIGDAPWNPSANSWFRAFANGEVYANNQNRVYHQGFKPSADDVGAVPKTRKINNQALDKDLNLTSSDVGAAPRDHSHSGYVPTTRKVNGKDLTTDITLSAADVKALDSEKGGTVKGDVSVTGTMDAPTVKATELWSKATGLRLVHSAAENNAGIYWGNPDQWSRIFCKGGILQVTDGATINRVYHQGYKPTPADIGAFANKGALGATNLNTLTDYAHAGTYYQDVSSSA